MPNSSYGTDYAPQSPDPRHEGEWGDQRLTGQPEVEALRRPRERGLPGWLALIVLLVIAGIGGVIDTASGSHLRGGFNIALVIASIVGILIVRRRNMFTMVVAPPLVYAVASAAILYLRSGGLHNRRVLFDAAANWLVYGFPAIAAATFAVLVIAVIRMIRRT